MTASEAKRADEMRRAERAAGASYDRIPYPSGAYPRTHPDRLATLATLYGLEPPPITACRVLELGCSDGGNLLPMAVCLPGSRFVGIDVAPRQIEAGRRRVEALGLDNVELEAISLLDVGPELGLFDYVLAHGVFSWVPEPMQEKILEICRTNLAPRGVAYVSYNTLPGWYMRRQVRDTMLFHTRKVDDPERAVELSFELIGLLADSVEGEDDPMASFLRWSREHLGDYLERPTYLVHEYLEDDNRPLYFEQFMRRAERHGLRYLAEAEPEVNEVGNLPPKVARYLERFAEDRLELEQYMDFARSRSFRWTLLCHGDGALERSPETARMRGLHASCAARYEPPKSGEDGAGSFTKPSGETFSTRDPTVGALLVELAAAWPESRAFDALAAGPGGGDEDLVADILTHLYFAGVVDLRTTAPALTGRVGRRPRASPLARLQAREGVLVTNQRHESVKMESDLGRFLLVHLDGSHDLDALAGLLEREIETGRLVASARDGGGRPTRDLLRRAVESQLEKMAGFGLLVG